jgi:hypothetical protein
MVDVTVKDGLFGPDVCEACTKSCLNQDRQLEPNLCLSWEHRRFAMLELWASPQIRSRASST